MPHDLPVLLRMKSFIHNYRVSVPIAAALVVGLAWLAFGYFGVHTLFIDKEVSEAVPTFDAPAVEAESAAVSAPATAPPAEQPADVATADVATADVATAEVATGDAPEPVADQPADQPSVETDEPAAADAAPTASPTVATEYSGSFESDAHPTSGEAVVLGNGTGQRFLRFEDFETDNGPDLNVYLVNSSTGDVSDYVDLGDLKGNIGDQNYEIPGDVDLDVYDQVVIWCVRFGVGFGDAEIMPTA